MEEKMKHLDMIQCVINRMANCSFALKGWAVTLVVALSALASKDSIQTYYLIACIPIAVFWFLDSYYLYQERLYRELFEKTRKSENKDIDYDMNANCDEFKTDKNTYIRCILSKTEIWLYLPLAALCLMVVLLPFC